MSYQSPPRSTSWIVLESIALVTLDVIILVGNLVICVVIYKRKPLQTLTNMLVVTLAISDLVTASITMPIAATTSILNCWVFGQVGCQVFGFFSKYLAHVSLYIITLIALNRYFRIVRPSVYRSVFTAKRSLLFMAFIWLVPAVVRIVPVIAGSARFVFKTQTSACILSFYDRRSQIPYTVLAIFAFVALPMLVIIACYAAVSRFVRKHKRRIFSFQSVRGNPRDLRVSVEEVKITRTLFALVFTFIVCWLPVSVALIFVKAATGRIPTIAARVLSGLVALSSASTPFVYGMFSRPFRRECKKVFSSCWEERRTGNGHESARGLEPNPRGSPQITHELENQSN